MQQSLRLRDAAGVLMKSLDRRAGLMLGAAVVCALAASGLAAAAPVALKYLLEALTGNLPDELSFAPAVWLAAYVAALLSGRLVSEGRSALFGAAEQSLVRRLSRDAIAHALALPIEVQMKRSTGAVVQTLENGLQGFRLILQHGLFTLLPGIAEIALIAALMLHFFDAAFLGIFSICAAGYCIVFTDGARRILRASRAVSAARIEANAGLADGLMNSETAKAFSGEARLTGLYDEALSQTQGRWQRFYRAKLLTGVLVALVFSSGLGAALWLAAGRVAQGTMTAGDLVLLNAWMLQVVRPLELFGYGLRDIGQGAAFIERLQELLSEPAEQALGGHATLSLSPPSPVSVRFENVSFSFENGRKVLDNISARIEPGQRVALVGPSGSGKSTLIRLLMKFHEPEIGRIFVNDQPLSGITPGVFRKDVAYVAQAPGLFNQSIAFNVAFPEPGADKARISAALARVGLSGLDKSDTGAPEMRLGENGMRLSGGERQRIAIARALIRSPRLILADEPTSALDPVTEERVLRELEASAQGATMIMATHRLRAAQEADLILVLSGGRIVERGRHEGLIRKGGLYAQMWEQSTK